jgi:hypothetical protein
VCSSDLGKSYSALRGLFRQYSVIFIAGDELDLVRLRTNLRQGEVTRLYRMNVPPEVVRRVFLGYLRRINGLRDEPEWYNALVGNCMIDFARIARHESGTRNPWHWSAILNGYADEHAYQLGMLEPSLPFAELRRVSRINDQAVAAGAAPDFSARIRAGLPGMGAATPSPAQDVQRLGGGVKAAAEIH